MRPIRQSAVRRRLFLSQEAWRELFGGDPGTDWKCHRDCGPTGFDCRRGPQDSWQLPGQVDAWLLEDEQHLDMLPANSTGFVLAHMRTTGSVTPTRWMAIHDCAQGRWERRSL